MLPLPSSSLPQRPEGVTASGAQPSMHVGQLPPVAPTSRIPQLPQEVWHQILGWTDLTDHRTVRSVSQTSRALNDLAQTAYGPAYGAAHRATLSKAMTLRRFDFHNRRAQNVLKGFCGLQLFAGPRQSAPISWSKWQQLPPLQLRAVVAALPQVTSLWVGGDHPSHDVLAQLLAADFPFERLISLTLDDAWFWRAELPQLMTLLPQATRLRHLTIPGRLRPARIWWQAPYRPLSSAVAAPTAPPGAQAPHAVSFAALAELTSFTWQPALMPPVLLDFSANAALRSITLARATLGPEPPASSQAVAVRWPREGLSRLHLWQCQWLPGFSRHVAAHAMAHTLVELVLNVECTYEPIDLGAFVALRCLKLLGDPFDLGEVRPPLKAPLARLIVQGRNQEPFWARMAASTYATLRHLGVTVPRRGDSGPLPFGAMPNLTHLTFRDPTRRSREAAVTSLSALDLPADNIIGTLTLEGYVLQPTLELVPLPNLRRLKLGAHVPSPRWASFLDEVLSRRPAPWPHLERVTVLASTRSAATVACLQPVLARHGIALHAERVEAPPSAALDF